MAKRTDVHCDTNIVPMDYNYVLWYDLGSGSEPGFNVDCERPHFDWRLMRAIPGPGHHGDRCCLKRLHVTGVRFAGIHGGSGQCDICGAYFRYGDVWRHRPTGEHIHVGHECADKYSMIANREDLKAYRKAVHEARSIAAKEQKKIKTRDEFLKEHDLVKVFELRNPESPKNSGFNPAWILHDMYGKLHQYGSLSEKQIAFARKLANQILNPRSKEKEKHVPAPVGPGRIPVKGTVVSVKHYDTDYGPSTKMTVKVETPDGFWLVWTTVPVAISTEFWATPGQHGEIADWLKGKTVEFTATLTRGNDEHFAFGKRPSKARVVA